jgi:hypothetical protein
MGINHVSQHEVPGGIGYRHFARDAYSENDSGEVPKDEKKAEGSAGSRGSLSHEADKATRRKQAISVEKDKENSAGPAIEVSFSPAARIASHYDLTRMTSKEVKALADELLDGKIIPFDLYTYLSFQAKLADPHRQLVENYTGEGSEEEPYNLLSRLQETLDIQEEAQASETAISRTRTLLNLMTNLNYMGNLGL